MRLQLFLTGVLFAGVSACRAQADYGPDERLPFPPAPGMRNVVETRIDRNDPAHPLKQTKIVYTLDQAGRPMRADDYSERGWVLDFTTYAYQDSLLVGKTFHYRPGMLCLNCPKPLTDSPFRRTSGYVYRYQLGLQTESDFFRYTPEPVIVEQARTRYDARGRSLLHVWKSTEPTGTLTTRDSLVERYAGDTVFSERYDLSAFVMRSDRQPRRTDHVAVHTRNAAGKIIRSVTVVDRDGPRLPAVYRYDAAGRYAGTDWTYPDSSQPDGFEHHREVWRYDGKGRLLRITHFLNGRSVYENRYVYQP